MVGIKGIGVHIPYLRYNRQDWVKVWDLPEYAPIMLGERTVANYDEDTVTMAVEASLNIVGNGGMDEMCKEVDGLYFASTSAPYAEKSSAAIIASAVDVSEDARTTDFSGSLRAGTTALITATDAVKAGTLNNVVVTSAEIRLSEPRFYMETMMGDSAAAVIVGKDNLICEILDSISITSEFIDVWRRSSDTFLSYDDERYASTHGYLKFVPMAIQKLLSKSGLKPDSINKIVAYAPEGASYMAIARRSGFPHLWNQDPLLMNVGNAGCASPLLQLASVLEDAKPDQKILLIGYGNGVDVILLRVTDNIEKVKGKIGVRKQINHKKMTTYGKTLHYRDIISRNRPSMWEFQPFTSIASLDRQRKYVLALYGNRCPSCELIFYPPKRVCPRCKNREGIEDMKLKKTGKIYSFEIDRVFPNPELPTCMAVVDLDGGGRFLAQMTDYEPEKVDVGMPVQLSLRRYHEAKGIYHYFWKAKPKID